MTTSVGLHFAAGCMAASYSRNNKESGQKNLRCFPRCDARGHVERGFCGVPLSVRVSGALHPAGGRRPLRVWGEFSLAHAPPSVAVGQELSLEVVVELRERSRSHPQADWVRGELSLSGYGSEFVFNRARLGWHYGWVSNVHTCESDHVLRCYVFEERERGAMVCLAVQDSPSFRVVCSRRLSHKRPLSPASGSVISGAELLGDEGSDGEGDQRPLKKCGSWRSEGGQRPLTKCGSWRSEGSAGPERELPVKRVRIASEKTKQVVPTALSIVEMLSKQRLPPPALDACVPTRDCYPHSASLWPSWNPLSSALGEVLSGVDNARPSELGKCCSESKLREIAPLLFNNAA
jgi:hypothetical protein